MECFTVHAEQIEGRIDPFYYKPEFIKIQEAIHNSKFEFKEIIPKQETEQCLIG